MKPEDDPWLKNAHDNAELLDREIKNLVSLTSPIRENRPIITKYQDFWNKAKQITGLFKELKPLAKSDRDLLWKQFNGLCRDVKDKQKAEYGTLESLSLKHLEEIMKIADLALLPPGIPAPGIHELVECGQALKNAGDQLGRFKHAMIAKHKKACFDKIQSIRKTHDAAWESINAVKPKQQTGTKFRARKNLELNYERQKKLRGLSKISRSGGTIYAPFSPPATIRRKLKRQKSSSRKLRPGFWILRKGSGNWGNGLQRTSKTSKNSDHLF